MRKSTLLVILFALVSSFQLLAQNSGEPVLEEADPNAAFKASFLFMFAKSCDWPDTKKEGEFVLSVVGSKRVFDELSYTYASKPVGSQVLVVELLTDLKNITRSHVIFVSRSQSKLLPEVVRLCKGLPILIVSETDGGLGKGAALNFIVVDNATRYELNQQHAKDAFIEIGAKLTQFAIKP
jgi:hypothetical protein